MKNYLKMGLVLILIVFFSLLGRSLFAQSIMVDNQNRIMLVMSEEEKAIKASSTCIVAKKDLQWETTINSQLVQWKLVWLKDSKLYMLYKNNTKYYESSTITGVRSKYASDLLGRDIKIQ